jgi:hypothetical protein
VGAQKGGKVIADVADILEGLGALLAAIAWPLAILAVAYVLFIHDKGNQALMKLVSRFRRVKAAGIELELSWEGASETRAFTDRQFRELRTLASSEFDRLVGVWSIDERHEHLVTNHIIPVLQAAPGDSEFRSTIHVPDVLFRGSLYQLIDYYGDAPGKRGRAFSIRFGIVGRAWRLGEPQIEGRVPTNSEELVREWGMTRGEATERGHGKHSFAAIPLRDEKGVSVGVLYLDARRENAFGTATHAKGADELGQRLIEAVAEGATATGLAEALAALTAELRKRGPAIQVFEVGE